MIFNYFLIALYSSGAINQVYAAFVFSIIILVGKPIFSRNKIIVNGLSSPAFWIIFLFCLSYVVIGELTVQGFLYYLLNPCLVFITGWALMDQCGHNLGAVITVIKFMALGYGIHALLNYVTNFGRPRWLLTDFFSGEIRAATGSGAINTLIFSLLICIICLEKRIVVKLVVFSYIFCIPQIFLKFRKHMRVQIWRRALTMIFPVQMITDSLACGEASSQC